MAACRCRNSRIDCRKCRDEEEARDKNRQRFSRTKANQKFRNMVRDGFWDDNEEWEAV